MTPTADMNETAPKSLPHPLVALIPILVLILFLCVAIYLFGSDSLSGGSQMALLLGTAVCITLSLIFYRVPWKAFEERITKTIGDVAVTLLILLAVGMLSGSWMVSGVVPTLIYYGDADSCAQQERHLAATTQGVAAKEIDGDTQEEDEHQDGNHSNQRMRKRLWGSFVHISSRGHCLIFFLYSLQRARILLT